ncbi:NGG1p interacting factor NIF3, partial [Patescibacteria group bacterium]|nr:NGG1p interacting factor NIF3 [Patescibacteria group bacterium]
EKGEFDQEKLTNPYSDTRYFTDNPNKKVKRVYAGIDIDVAELLLVDRALADKPADLIIGHHPLGKALAGMYEVMKMQIEMLAMYGVPIHLAEDLMKKRIAEVSRSLSPINHNKVIDAAQKLGFPLLCVHTPADNLVFRFLKKLIDRNQKKLEFVKDVLYLLKSIPEYQQAMVQKAGPQLFTGVKENYCGKIALTELTGGTSGAKEIYEKLSQVGISTIISMHMNEEHKEEAAKQHLNMIVAGHMASDSIGMNLLLDELEKRGVEVATGSGLIRVKRFKKVTAPSRKKKK